ncbi:MAG: PepSY domain-containing protein [Candidatus Melainabacteria bacterium]|jgi:uncharacterized membrane protein YkoI|nr:PepSY domain-containing protein [Candidatus Melainabacteria bacterium]
MKKMLVMAVALTMIGSSFGTCAFADDDTGKRGQTAKLTKKEAEAIALKQLSGTITDSDLERMHKKPHTLYYSVSVKGEKEKKNFHINATDGSIMKVTNQDMDD